MPRAFELAQGCHAQGLKLILYFGGGWGNGAGVKAQWEKSHYDFARSDGVVYPPADYHAARVFYRGLDEMIAAGKGKWRFENCSSGGDFRSLDVFRRMTWMTHSDGQGVGLYFRHISDWSFMLAPIQIRCDMLVGPGEKLLPDQPGRVQDFRAFLLGSILTGDPARWEPVFKERFKEVCRLYNTRQRAILRGCDVYRIQPKAPWFGIQYDNPAIGKGSVLLWQNGGPASQVVKLKGLDRDKTYLVSFEDAKDKNGPRTGAQLMDEGLNIPMGPNASEIVWLDLSK